MESTGSGTAPGTARRRAAAAALGALAAATLAGCASFREAMALPNSRVMTWNTLNGEIRPGMAQSDVIARIGRPAYTFPVGWQRLEVWNYRFARPEGDCVVFQVSFANATGLVTETGQGPDQACDGPNWS
jgi:outer membrane protein assembly factor BamE (lipoprotein component of BamABCDE complex)